MKRTESGKWKWGLLLPLPLLLIASGVCMTVHIFRRCQQVIQQHESHEALLAALEPEAFSLLIYGGLIMAGMCLLVMLCLRLVSRGQREIRELREKNAAMEQLNRQTQALAHHQRLELIGTLTSSIAHEFNNLLTPIMGYSLMALERIPEEDTELYDALVEVYDASRKAKTLISRLSDLSRKNAGEYFREVSPDELVRKALDVAAPAKPEAVELRLSLNCQEQTIHANELQLSQMLLNLILNAFHAMKAAGGILTVETQMEDDAARLRVSDTGCGIPESVLPHIFDPFFTTKQAGEGTGLGLAIVAQVVEEHHGSIHVDSRVGKGTTFTVTLPRSFDPGGQESSNS
ncbi:MAG: ATP-binding protein [Firmicutes bacterium]|nr:ATP-binding protein [Bacillota bacterium]